MSDAVIAKLSTIDLASLVVIIILVSVILRVLTPYYTKLKNKIIKKYKREQDEEDLAAIIRDTQSRVSEYETNRINDRKQSFQIQQQLTDAIKELNYKFDTYSKSIEDRFNENRERDDKRVRAELKDRIGQSYRYYHSRQEWNSMEKEALVDLVAEYEAAGGKNSFVHSVVEKEMYTWKLID